MEHVAEVNESTHAHQKAAGEKKGAKNWHWKWEWSIYALLKFYSFTFMLERTSFIAMLSPVSEKEQCGSMFPLFFAL